MSIDPIKLGANGIGSGYGLAKKSDIKEDGEAKKPEAGLVANDKAQVSAEAVFDYMAQSSVSLAPKTVDTSKYVDKASADRIAGFMASFEDIVATNLSAITAEFPDMSAASKQALAVAQVNQQMPG